MEEGSFTARGDNFSDSKTGVKVPHPGLCHAAPKPRRSRRCAVVLLWQVSHIFGVQRGSSPVAEWRPNVHHPAAVPVLSRSAHTSRPRRARRRGGASPTRARRSARATRSSIANDRRHAHHRALRDVHHFVLSASRAAFHTAIAQASRHTAAPSPPPDPTATLCSQPPSEARPARSSRRHHPSRLAPRPLPLTAASSARAIERAN